MGKHAKSIDQRILKRIRAHRRGWVFTSRDFVDIASATTVKTVLRRHAEAGHIRQLGRGLYDYPRKHPRLGLLSPAPQDVAEALAGRDGAKVQPSGAYAANLLGLSEQVPARLTFVTDGPSRAVTAGTMLIQVKHTAKKDLAVTTPVSSLLIQAFKHLGSRHIGPEQIEQLRRNLPPEARRKVLQDVRFAPTWMRPLLRELAEQQA